MNNETDARKAELQSRRYHVEIHLDYADGCEKSGEFYYDSLRSARRFLRQQFLDWEKMLWISVNLKNSDWKDIWSSSALNVRVALEEDRIARFYGTIVDTQDPCDVEHEWLLEIDLTAEVEND